MLKKIINHTNISEHFRRVIFKKIQVPIVSSNYETVDNNYFSYPPMLVPMFADYDIPSINGILMHPFSNRTPSFVRFNLEEGFFRERSLNSDQFITQMVLEMIMIEEEITAEISKFCDEVEFKYLDEVNLFSDKYGDNDLHFDKLVHFQNNTPLHYCNSLEDYSGTFLSSDKLINLKAINDASTFELSDKVGLEEDIQYPIWFENDDLVCAFYNFINQKRFREAWLCLNSGSWTKEDLSKGLLDMKNEVSNTLFNLLCDYWLTNNID